MFARPELFIIGFGKREGVTVRRAGHVSLACLPPSRPTCSGAGGWGLRWGLGGQRCSQREPQAAGRAQAGTRGGTVQPRHHGIRVGQSPRWERPVPWAWRENRRVSSGRRSLVERRADRRVGGPGPGGGLYPDGWLESGSVSVCSQGLASSVWGPVFVPSGRDSRAQAEWPTDTEVCGSRSGSGTSELRVPAWRVLVRVFLRLQTPPRVL